MYAITGVATIFVGWIQLLLIKNRLEIKVLQTLLKGSVIFTFIIGSSAVATMWDNAFAYFVLLVAVCQIIIYKKVLKR